MPSPPPPWELKQAVGEENQVGKKGRGKEEGRKEGKGKRDEGKENGKNGRE